MIFKDENISVKIYLDISGSFTPKSGNFPTENNLRYLEKSIKYSRLYKNREK